MGIIQFKEAHIQRASAGSRAANFVNASEVRPESRATFVSNIADHFATGMLSRYRHLTTVGTKLSASDASSSREGHKSITSRKERKLAIPTLLGQSVLKRKDNLALDSKKALGHTVRMGEMDIKAQYEQEFIDRVKAARIATGKKQWQVAELMGIKQDQYKHYETGRVVPHHLIGRFCLICSIDPNWLITGKGAKPLRATHAVEAEEQPVPKPKRAKRSRAA